MSIISDLFVGGEMTVNPYEIIGDCEQSTARVAGIGFTYKTNRSLLTLPLSNLVLR